ncbi:IS3 family transposase, partial [Bacillaceae bacterium SAS-127]
MAKFTAEDKLQTVERYLNGNESSTEIAKSLRTDHKAILKWVKQYEYNGVEAFIKSCTSYTQQFKLDVLNYIIEQGTSLNETAAIFKIPAPSTIVVWKNLFETQRLDALQSK